MQTATEKITRRLGLQMNLSVPDLVHGVLHRKDAWVSNTASFAPHLYCFMFRVDSFIINRIRKGYLG